MFENELFVVGRGGGVSQITLKVLSKKIVKYNFLMGQILNTTRSANFARGVNENASRAEPPEPPTVATPPPLNEISCAIVKWRDRRTKNHLSVSLSSTK